MSTEQPVDPEPIAVAAPRPAGVLAGNRKMYIAIAMLVLALGYFGFTAFQGATMFYLTVDELLAGRAEVGESVRVSGKLIPESFSRETDGTLAYFSLTNGTETLPAVYDGAGLPDLFFNEHSDIVLEGKYQPDGVFETTTVVVTCPSKYQGEEVEPGAVLQ